MDYPHGRQPHHGGGRREEEEEEENRYERPHPPPFFGGDGPSPPSRPHQPPHYGGDAPPPPFYGGDAPPPPFYGGDAPPPPFYGGEGPSPPSRPHYGGDAPPPPQVYHTSHTGPPGPESYRPSPLPAVSNHYPAPPPASADHSHKPHFPHRQHKEEEPDNEASFKMYSKAEPNYALTIRDGKVVLARADPSDPLQHWIKDVRLSTRVKDEEGFPSFALVNKATGQAIKHATGATHPVQLTRHNPNSLDESILWTESKDLGDGYRAIRMVNNIRLNIDAFNGDQQHGGVRDGTKIVLWEWKKGDNQRWRICPH